MINQPPILSISPAVSSTTPSAVGSAQKHDDLSKQIAALPEPEVSKHIPLTEHNLDEFKKALEKYCVTPAEAMNHPLAWIVGTMEGSATALSKATLNPIPFTSWRFPLLPLLSLKCLGVKKTLALYTAIGAVGGFYGRVKAASEIYQKTPEDNLKEKITSLGEACSELKDQMLHARLDRLRAQNKLRQLAPMLSVRDREKLSNEIKLSLNKCLEMTMPTEIRFYEKQLEKQAPIILELKERIGFLEQQMSKGKDVKLELLRTMFDLDAESDAFDRVQKLLDNAKDTPVQDVAGHAGKLDKLASAMTEGSMLPKTLEAQRQFLEADSKLNKLQSDFIQKQKEFINALVQEQRFRLARGQGMTTKKEDKEASRAAASGSADSQSQTTGVNDSSSV